MSCPPKVDQAPTPMPISDHFTCVEANGNVKTRLMAIGVRIGKEKSYINTRGGVSLS